MTPRGNGRLVVKKKVDSGWRRRAGYIYIYPCRRISILQKERGSKNPPSPLLDAKCDDSLPLRTKKQVRRRKRKKMENRGQMKSMNYHNGEHNRKSGFRKT
jgi:hypothetical protein